MKAAVVSGKGLGPRYAEFEEPVAGVGEVLIAVRAAALTQLTKARAMGSHYSAGGGYPLVAGFDGVGMTKDGRRVFFVMPTAPFGSMGEFSVVRREFCIDVPAGLGDVKAAALGNPGMSAWAAVKERGRLEKEETVLVNGATGSAGRMAVQAAKYLGAGRVIVCGRNAGELEKLKAIGADVVVPFDLGAQGGAERFEEELVGLFGGGIGVVVDYLWGASAGAILAAVAKGGEGAGAVRFVQVGEAGGESRLNLAAAALRSSPVVLMGSGLKSGAGETAGTDGGDVWGGGGGGAGGGDGGGAAGGGGDAVGCGGEGEGGIYGLVVDREW